ncbi:hypothetical protein [Pseudomonas viridiflava]|uniref:hypothetical protein n=1 Tax=Pseudomonas viridiflava TaxID=33069 RepID=UPI0013CE5994|nr:hypothetical protein [Pseudomonas viridiflava]
MEATKVLKRSLYKTEEAHARAIDQLIDQVGEKFSTDDRRQLMFSLMRECRGCGVATTHANTQMTARFGGQQQDMVCVSCRRAVPIPSTSTSIGKMVSLWNSTPLTIEGAVCQTHA